MIVKSGRFVTAGAALSHIDLALWLVRAVSPKLASLTAKYLIVDSRPSQSAYALTGHLVHSDLWFNASKPGRARVSRTGFLWTRPRVPSGRASERLPDTCRWCSESRRCRISRVCAWSERSIFSRPAARAWTKSRDVSDTRKVRFSGFCCGDGSGSALNRSGAPLSSSYIPIASLRHELL